MKDILRVLSRLPLLAVVALGGCQAYDSALLVTALEVDDATCGDAVLDSTEFCDTEIESGMDGACPTECESSDACAPLVLTGKDCQRRCMTVHVSGARNGDGCCPPQASPAEDDDCGACGDGVIGPSESCDPPGSCPSTALCKSTDACIVAVFTGKAKNCTARCELRPISDCVDDDGCCPSGCTGSDDNDCSSTCGDGVVDSHNETCEPKSRSAACPSSCDDEDTCTRDLLVGSATNCNARCTHTAITKPASNDGCCPRGAHALNDADCAAVCGNGVTEPGEDCDFGELCSETCKLMFHPSLVHRYRFNGRGTVAADTVGGANGTIVNTELSDAGYVQLAGGRTGQYVDLPNGLLSSLNSATIEVWLAKTVSANNPWERIFDFGNNQGGEGNQSGAATSFLFLTASNDEGGVGAYVNFSSAAGDVLLGDRRATTGDVLRNGSVHHVAVVFDGEQGTLQLYVDGALSGSVTGLSGELANIDDRNMWIGRSNWGNEDLAAQIREFRIYSTALSATDVRNSYQNGSDPPAEFPLN